MLSSAARRLRSWALAPEQLTTGLTAAVAAAGVVAVLHLPAAPVLLEPALHGWWSLALLTGLLLLTELGQAHVEVRRQAYSFSLTGIPLVLGLLFCPPVLLVAARVVSAAAAFAVQRTSPVKSAWNLAAYLLDASLLVLLLVAFAGGRDVLDVRTAVAVYAAMALVDLLMTGLVLVVIRINSGPVALAEVVDVVVSSSVFVVVNAVAGILAAVLARSGDLGWVLLLACTAVVLLTHRVHLVLRRRHASLEVVKDFVELAARTSTERGDLAGVLLGRVREVLRAERAELVLPAGGASGGGWVVASAVDEDGARAGGPLGRRSHDATLLDAARRGRGLLVAAGTRDAEHRRWLTEEGRRELLACPLGDDEEGLVVVTDRLGDTATFTPDDLSLLGLLTGHVAVALRSERLLERLHHEATHDALTGLADLAGLEQHAAEARPGQEAAGGRVAVLALGLGRVEEVNAVLGHQAGDELLVLVARRLEQVLPGAVVARTGDDEFAALLELPVDRPGARGATERALATAARVEQALASPVQLSAGSVSTSASTGVAVGAPGEPLGEVLRRARTARSAGRSAGAGPTAYRPAMDEGRAERVQLLADLHRAIEGGELELHYQPKLDLALGLVTGVEALVRWEHPRLGRLSPDRFVPLAESTGLVEPFTHSLLAQALAQARRWQDDGVDLSVAVNLSARNIANPELPDLVASALAAAGVPAGRLVLELTESAVMGDEAHGAAVLERLAATGVTISLDDFGTGYSSLSYLQRMPVAELKVDRSFVRGLEDGAAPQDAAVSATLIRSITALKDVLGLRVVAEGVEHAAVVERVRDLGCDLVQGFHVSRPVPAGQLDAARFRRSPAPAAR